MPRIGTERARELGKRSGAARRKKAEERRKAQQHRKRAQKLNREGMRILECMNLWPEFKAYSWKPWRVFLSALFGLPLSDFFQ